MGHDVYSTRKTASWAYEEDKTAISLAEWQEYVARDSERRLNSRAAAPVRGNSNFLSVAAEGLSVWLAYSKNGCAGNYD